MASISSLSNPNIKELMHLKKNSERKKQGLFVIDGAREIGLALAAGWEISSLFYCPTLVEDGGDKISALDLGREKIVEVSENVFRKICYKENPDGFLATAKSKKISLGGLVLNDKPLVVILERVEKPGNLGAILRTAYAVGAAAVVVNDNQTDIYNPNVIRASEGMIFTQKVVGASIPETVKWLKDNKIKSFAAATTGSKKYTSMDFTGPVAVVLGSEADGLTPQWLAAADKLIKIPMRHGIDSLNVSVSAAVILFEALRQREI